MPDSLAKHIRDHIGLGCLECCLGIQGMPSGYALMIDADRMYYYWLRHDGVESVINWDKWAVYRGAKEDALRRKEQT